MCLFWSWLSDVSLFLDFLGLAGFFGIYGVVECQFGGVWKINRSANHQLAATKYVNYPNICWLIFWNKNLNTRKRAGGERSSNYLLSRTGSWDPEILERVNSAQSKHLKSWRKISSPLQTYYSQNLHAEIWQKFGLR